VPGQHVGFDERTRIQQQLQAFPGGELPPGVLLLDGVGAAPQRCLRLQAPEVLDALLDRAQVGPRGRRGRLFGVTDRGRLLRHGRLACHRFLALFLRVRHGV
jgi:hypothetical protein